MSSSMDDQDGKILAMTAEIVAGYTRNNHVSQSNLPELMDLIYAKLNGYSAGMTPMAAAGNARLGPPGKPAVPINKSYTKDYIICLESGEKFKTLKRHIKAKYGLTPEEYKARWNLPMDYPMVASNYSKKRSETAKKTGLGRKSGRKAKSGRWG